MAETSFYWGGTSVGDASLAPYTDDQFSDNWSVLFQYDRTAEGVVLTNRTGYTGLLAVSAPGANTVRVSNGFGLVDGKLYQNDANVDFTPADGSWTVVLRKDWAAQTVRLAVRASGGLTQTDGATWEIPLADVTLAGGAVTVLTDRRAFLRNPGSGQILIRRDIIGSAGGTIDWTSIPQVFKDLLIVIHGQSNAVDPVGTLAYDGVETTINGDAGANYDSLENSLDQTETPYYKFLSGQNYLVFGAFPAELNVNGWGDTVIRVNNYADANNDKNFQVEFFVRNDGSPTVMGKYLGMWNSVDPINRITMIGEYGVPDVNFKAGSTFSLFGIM